MELLTRELPPDHDIVIWGDTHYGSAACSLDTVRAIVKRIKSNKHTYTAFLGDAIEAKMVDSPHFSHEVHDARKTPVVQITEWCDLVRPIPKNRWLCINTGNHEKKHFRFGDLTRMACENLGVPYGGFTAKHRIVNAKTGLPMYKMITTHGSKVANSTAPDPLVRRKIVQAQVKRSLAVLGHADCVASFCGHGHKLVVVKPMHEPFLMDNGEIITGHYTAANHSEGWIDESLRWYGMCGTQHRTVVLGACTYSEVAGFGVAQLGFIEMKVRGGAVKEVNEIHLGHV